MIRVSKPSLKQTRATLLLQLKNADAPEVWEAFVRDYAPVIFYWCRERGLQDADASDVTQDVLCGLLSSIRKFEYDREKGSFRGWLKTVTHNAVNEIYRRNSRQQMGFGSSQDVVDLVSVLPDEVAMKSLSDAIEREAESVILAEAERSVQAQVRPHLWETYHRTAVLQERVADVANELGITVSAAYIAKSRVLKKLRHEVAKIEQMMHESMTSGTVSGNETNHRARDSSSSGETQ